VDDRGTRGRPGAARVGHVVRQGGVRGAARGQAKHAPGVRHVDERARAVRRWLAGRGAVRLRARLVPFDRAGTPDVHTAGLVAVLRVQRFRPVRRPASPPKVYSLA